MLKRFFIFVTDFLAYYNKAKIKIIFHYFKSQNVVVVVKSCLVVVVVVDAAGSKHEAVHAHAQVLPVSLQAFPHEHARPLLAGHLTSRRRQQMLRRLFGKARPF